MLTLIRKAFLALHQRITAKIVIALLACVWGTVALDAYLMKKVAAARLGDELRTQARVVAAAVHRQLSGGGAAGLDLFLRELQTVSGARRIALVDPSWKVVSSSDPEEVGSTLAPASALGTQGGAGGMRATAALHSEACRGIDNPALAFLAAVVIDPPGRDLSLAAYPGRRMLEYYELVGMLVILATVLVVIWVVVQRPLSQLMVAITRIRGGDLNVHCEVLVEDEFGRLAASINAMLAALHEKNRELQLLHETQIVQADRLASVGQLASGLAHEIKAPLHGVLSALEVLQAHSREAQTGAVLAQIQAQIGRVVAIATDMLSYACPHSPHFRLCDLADILERTLALLRADAEKHKVRLLKRVDAALPKTLVDGEQMQQVCLNLLLNAIEAAGAGGEVSVSMTWQRESNLIAIRVTDSGPGVSDAVAARLFEPFFTTKKGGHGLGLATSRMLVTQNHGTIRLLRTTGTSACFEVLLPVTQEDGLLPAPTGVQPGISDRRSSAVDAYLFGLACHCPLGIGEFCPAAVLRDIRRLDMGERYEAIGKLSEAEKASLQATHVACSFEHRGGVPPQPTRSGVLPPGGPLSGTAAHGIAGEGQPR
jgi:signal transduction histidine kinase